MGRSRETYNKKEVRKRKEKKRKEKELRRLERKENEQKSSLDNMIAYVDEDGMITSTPPDPKKKKDIKLEDIELSVPNKNSDEDPDPVRQGTVTFYSESKGYGFIKDSETQENIFVHKSSLLEEIQQGNTVTFEIIPGKKGFTAVQVKPIR